MIGLSCVVEQVTLESYLLKGFSLVTVSVHLKGIAVNMYHGTTNVGRVPRSLVSVQLHLNPYQFGNDGCQRVMI